MVLYQLTNQHQVLSLASDGAHDRPHLCRLVTWRYKLLALLLLTKKPRRSGGFCYFLASSAGTTLTYLRSLSFPVKDRIFFLVNSTTPSVSAKSVSSSALFTPLPALNFEPLCLMMMLPAFTVCEPKILTPSRFEIESRPRLVEPPAFLCAI